MARRRIIDPSIWTDEGMAQLSVRQQLLYVALFSNADDEGRLKGAAISIQLMLPTVYGGEGTLEVEDDLQAVLRCMTQVISYEIDGRRYLQFMNYGVWQKIDRPTPSRLPAPESLPFKEGSSNGHRSIVESSSNSRASRVPAGVPAKGKLREEKGSKGKGSEEGANARRAARPHAREETASPAAAQPTPRAISPVPKPEPKPDRYGETLKAIYALAPDVVVSGSRDRNAKAVAESHAEPALIAEAYVAMVRGEWADEFVRRQGSVHAVVDALGGYVNQKQKPPGRQAAALPAGLTRDWNAEYGG